jgi:hypothetical protein
VNPIVRNADFPVGSGSFLEITGEANDMIDVYSVGR